MRAEDQRLAQISTLCEALPDTVRTVRGEHADFRVRGRVFAYFLNNHHGDGIVAVCVKSELGENLDRARSQPGRFYLPAYIGARGWYGLRLDQGPISWSEVEGILERSYCLIAPKSLVATVERRRAAQRSPE